MTSPSALWGVERREGQDETLGRPAGLLGLPSAREGSNAPGPPSPDAGYSGLSLKPTQEALPAPPAGELPLPAPPPPALISSYPNPGCPAVSSTSVSYRADRCTRAVPQILELLGTPFPQLCPRLSSKAASSEKPSQTSPSKVPRLCFPHLSHYCQNYCTPTLLALCPCCPLPKSAPLGREFLLGSLPFPQCLQQFLAHRGCPVDEGGEAPP